MRRGATDKEIIRELGINQSTFIDYKRKHPEFSQLIQCNRKNVVEGLKTTMIKLAMGFQYLEEKEITYPDGSIRYEKTRKTALPNYSALELLMRHWDKDEDGSYKWTNDPAALELKKAELQLKEQAAEDERW